MDEVILDCDLMRYPHSGLYHYCLNLGNYLQRMMKDQGGLRIKQYVPNTVSTTFEKKETSIVERPFHRFFNPFLWKCRIWHAPFQSGRIIPDKRKHRNIKILLTIHDLNSLHEGKSLAEQQRSISHTQNLINKSDSIVCVSEFCRNDVLKHCDIGNRPINVIHNGMNRVETPALRFDSYKPLRPFLFGVGYVNRKKNYHVLLSLLNNVDMELVIAGRPDDPEYIEFILQEANRIGVADKVTLTGVISEQEKSWYLQNCKAFVHPSLAEGFGFPVVEAMQFGKPLFLSDKTSLPEIGGDVAFYFRSFDEDHMRSVFARGMKQYNDERMMEMVINRSRQFDWEKNAREYIEVYKTLL